MTDATCTFCTGSRWLQDDRQYGPCVCAPTVTLLCGDNRAHLAAMPANSVDAVVCDPPYGLSKEPDMAEVLRHWLAGDDYAHDGAGFMGKTWDSFVPGPATWREVHRVLKPGGHLLAFFGTRTQDMGVLAIRLAGFEIRDGVAWLYGSGFPKSHDVSKAIDASLGVERARVRVEAPKNPPNLVGGVHNGSDAPRAVRAVEQGFHEVAGDVPATPEAEQWDGWGTALKPAMEPICVARKPLERGLTVAQNVLKWGTGALNIDGCRIHADDSAGRAYVTARAAPGASQNATGERHQEGVAYEGITKDGRWPANVAHDGSPEVLAEFPETTSEGSAARFFYCAKASTRDREEGLEGHATTSGEWFQTGNGASGEPSSISANRPPRAPRANNHPTVKPTALMQWLVRMVTPPGGLVLDPFMGSGSTGKAAWREGFHFTGIDLDPAYVEIARARIGA